MRRILMFNRVSADGSFAGPGDDLQWMTRDEALDKAVMSGPSDVDTFLLGRRTYELMAAFWPKAMEAPAATPAQAPHGGGALSDDQQKMARGLNAMTKLVVSRTLREAAWQPSRIVRELDPRAIAELKQGPGEDLLILGSGSIVSQLTRHRLIDEYQLVVSPLLLAGGRPLFDQLTASVPLRLISSQAFDSGNVLLRYERRE